MRQSTLPHVIFCVNFEKADWLGTHVDLTEVLRLEAHTGAPRKLRWSHDFPPVSELRRRSRFAADRHHAGRLIGLSDPSPKGVLIETQLPLGTNFQAFP